MTYPPNYDRWPEGDGHPAQYAPPPQKKKRTGLIVGLIVAILITLVVVVCAAMFGRDQAKQGVVDVDTTTTAPARQGQSQAAKNAPVKKPVATVGAGTYIVGKDITAGRYKTKGAEESLIQFCTWQTSKTDSFNDVIDFGTADKANQPGLVTLKKGQYFKTDGCQPWVLQ